MTTRVMWGDPPKPNLWKLETHYDPTHRSRDYMIKSPLFKDGQNILIFGSQGYAYVKFSKSTERITAYPVSPEKAISQVVSKEFWGEFKNKITPHLKIDKVASIKPKVMWGDPPKPNLWKIQEDINAEHLINGFVKSPLLNGIVRYSFLVGFGEFIVETNDYRGRRKVLEVFEKVDYAEGLEQLSSHGFWKRNKDEIKKLSVVNKVASSEPKVMWGDPPKPNLWKLFKITNFVAVIKSPLFAKSDVERGSIVIKHYPINNKYDYRVTLYGQVIALFVAPDFDEALSIVASKEFWDDHKKKIIPHLKVDKVASSEIKVMWGDPPKPNLWKLEKLSRTSRGFVLVVETPLADENFHLFAPFNDPNGRILLHYGEQALGAQSVGRIFLDTFSDFVSFRRFILSHECWEMVSHLIKRHLRVRKVAKGVLGYER